MPEPQQRQAINTLTHQALVDEVYLVGNKQLRPNRNGQNYIQVELSDRTGSVSARLWNAQEQHFTAFDDGDLVQVRGTAQLYQGSMQIVLQEIRKADPQSVDWNDFAKLSPNDVDRLAKRLGEILRSVYDPGLRALVEVFLTDEQFMSGFTRCPAGVKNHHAYPGGLLEHVVSLSELAIKVAEHYPVLNRDLLVLGCFLHDMGKIEELNYEQGFSYTDAGQLLGHVIQGITILDAMQIKAEELLGEPLNPELVLRLKHMIISHHGQYEFGSPKLPMTLEALALHQLDDLDAKLHHFQSLMHEDTNAESSWTQYFPNLGRKLFKGSK